MKNRIVSLFELEELVAPRKNGNGHGSRPKTRKPPRKACAPSPTTEAAKTGTATPTVSATTPAIAKSFDTGAPIRCDHSVAYPPVETVQVRTDQPTAVAHAQALDVHVEAFEGEDTDVEEPTVRISSDEETSQSLSAYEGAYEPAYEQAYEPVSDTADDAEPEETTANANVNAAALGAHERELPQSFAAQMEAVEADLAQLAARADHPAPNAPTPPAPDDQQPAPAPPRPAGGAPRGHDVFDAMAKGMGTMGYATEFRLPAVQLSQVFSALDRQLDADVAPAMRAKADAAPTPAVPSGEELLKDLVNIVPPSTPATPSVPAPDTTDSGTNAEAPPRSLEIRSCRTASRSSPSR
jgi:hypothetical protein